MLRFTLRQLEYAVAALDRGSVAAAAAQHGVAQPTMSAAIAKLEEQLDLQLFIRHHAQGITATAAGQRFLADARGLIAQAQELQRQSQAAAGVVAGTLSLGSFMTLAPAFAPRIIAGFRSRYPDVAFSLEEGTQQQLCDGLRSGRFDLALLYSVDMPDDLETVELASVAPHVLLPGGHRLARRRVALRALAEEPFILLDVQPSRTYFLRILASVGIQPKVAFSSPSLEVVRGLVAQGLGYSLLVTRPHGNHSYDGKGVATCDIADAVERGIIVLASLKQMRKTRLASAFEAYCVQHFKSIARRP